jgi:CRP-like cAMP-binding protein
LSVGRPRRTAPHRSAAAPTSAAAAGLPTIRAMPLSGLDRPRPLLTEQQRQRLAAVATRLQLPPRSIVYRDGDPADSIFINGGGIVVSFKEMASGKRRVAGFRFYADVFGLAEHGQYVNTTRAVTAVTLYRIPVEVLTAILRQDAELEFQFVCKIVDELRQAQRKSIIVARRDAAGRVAMFVDMLRHTAGHSTSHDFIEIPMSRSDIGDFLNLTLESVSRACRQLSDARILAFNKRGVRILDRGRFDELVTSG